MGYLDTEGLAYFYGKLKERFSPDDPNLSPFFAHDLNDKYDASTNPQGYWSELTAGYTQLDDGWVHFEFDNTSGSSNANRAFAPINCPHLEQGATYTIMLETRNVESVQGRSKNFIVPCYSAYQLATTGNLSFGTESRADPQADYFTTTCNSPTSARMLRGRCYVYAGGRLSLDFRMSLYKGDYSGQFVPYDSLAVPFYIYSASDWSVCVNGRTVCVQAIGATATPSASASALAASLADYAPLHEASAPVVDGSGNMARLSVDTDGTVRIIPAGYTSSSSWHGTLEYIY